ncbi:endolytic transglycosylase MltG [Woeseia oceani]|uniref:Endolytic murein transglycosylase n=1 Tax=Woeseia oceani TaxID=1548547 RepID=A0A193LFT8_9GAMM|nr:endolytic transglycosylase MltG [Woeseia oceani]ANO51400.1 hypothetical protein BA177_09475 [Woeseia oceani]
MQRLLRTLLLIAALAVVTLAAATWQAHRYLHSPLVIPETGLEFEIAQGASLAGISQALAERGILEHPRLFRWYGRLSGQATEIHAGEYRIDAGTTPVSLLQKFVNGEVQLHSFTVIEGWTFQEMLQALHRHPDIQSTIVYEDWPAVLQQLGSGYDHPEGLFLPETYRFAKGATDLDLLRQAHGMLQAALQEEWQARAPELPLASPYEALILASIIEKETGRADERARIAGVFVRRLQKRMRLQTDPTVIYGVGDEYAGNLTRRHLRTDTEYNTYTRHGLPPTPIALPGRDAIHAALNPADGNELFFVATGTGDGSHRFSETKEQHDEAVREYLKRLRSGEPGE